MVGGGERSGHLWSTRGPPVPMAAFVAGATAARASRQWPASMALAAPTAHRAGGSVARPRKITPPAKNSSEKKAAERAKAGDTIALLHGRHKHELPTTDAHDRQEKPDSKETLHLVPPPVPTRPPTPPAPPTTPPPPAHTRPPPHPAPKSLPHRPKHLLTKAALRSRLRTHLLRRVLGRRGRLLWLPIPPFDRHHRVSGALVLTQRH